MLRCRHRVGGVGERDVPAGRRTEDQPLDRLEARGPLRRTPDPADRRNRVVALTDAGRDLLGECRACVRALEEELLGPGERDVLIPALERLTTPGQGRASG
ncbi:MAG: hypothetical protein QOG20_2592 [Pseudonocardiales bacterium]|nr:hypothetical protein [Pseudonocardiales bacterium]